MTGWCTIKHAFYHTYIMLPMLITVIINVHLYLKIGINVSVYGLWLYKSDNLFCVND